MAGHLSDLKTAAFVLDVLANGRNVAEVREKKAGEGFDACLARETPVELVAKVAKGGAAIERHGSRGAEERRPADVELVFKLADDLLEHVFCGDETNGRTELVNHNGDVAATLLKLLQQLDGELGFGDNREFAHDLAKCEARLAAHGESDGAEVHEAGDVFRVDNADDVLRAEGGIVDGNAGVLLLNDAGGGLLQRHVDGEREDLAARRHDLANCDVVEFDSAMNNLFLKDGKQAHAAGSGGDEF